MGWSEQYWEDVRLELEEPGAALIPAGKDETPDQPVSDIFGDAIDEDAPAP